MGKGLFFRNFFCIFLISRALFSAAQPNFDYAIRTSAEECNKGFAALETPSVSPTDTVHIKWGTGEEDTYRVGGLVAGAYNVRIITKYKKDTVYLVKDTTLFFTIAKEQCPLLINKYFSPNDDGYNDWFLIGNIDKYPNFELTIFNKWGQRVHHQRKEFEPWNGKWLGANLPDGTYYYVIFYDESDKGKVVKGDVTILR
jgi:gliding motility-associated-like protein